MAILNFFGAETGDISEVASDLSVFGSFAASTTQKRTGSYSFKSLDGGYGYFRGWASTGKQSDLSATTLYATLYFYITSLPNGNGSICSIEGGTGNVVYLDLANSGDVTLVGTTTSSVIATLGTGSWVKIEIYGTANGTCGVSVNGGAYTTVTGNNTGSIVKMVLGPRYNSLSTNEWYYDDICYSDSAAPGVGEVRIAVPTGDSATNTNWSASAGNKWNCINEIPPNGGTDYIESLTTAGNRTYSATHDSSATLGITSIIGAVLTFARMWEPTSTTTLGAIGIRTAANFDLGDVDIGNTVIISMGALYELDPNDNQAWTTSKIDSAEPLIRRSTSDTSNIRCDFLALMVWCANVAAVTLMPAHGETIAPRPLWSRIGNTIVSRTLHLIGQDSIYGAPGQVSDIAIPNAQTRPRHYDRTFGNNANRLRGQDTIYGATGQAPDIQIPDARTRPKHYDKNISDDASRLIGQDRVYNGPGQVPRYLIDSAKTLPKHYNKDLSVPANPNLYVVIISVPFVGSVILGFNRLLKHYDKFVITNDSKRLIGMDIIYGDIGQVPFHEISSTQRLPKHFDKFILNATPRQTFLDPVPVSAISILFAQDRLRSGSIFYPSDLPQFLFDNLPPPVRPIDIIDFLSKPISGDIVSLNIVQMLQDNIPTPLRPVQIINFISRPKPGSPIYYTYNIQLYVPATSSYAEVILHLEKYLATLDVPEYVTDLQFDIYTNTLDTPEYLMTLHYENPNQTLEY